jgi:hypothetical protein
MPRLGTVRLSDLIEKVIVGLGGESKLPAIYERMYELPEGRERIEAKGFEKIKAQIRERLQRSGQFAPCERKGVWRLATGRRHPKRQRR